MTAVRVDGVSLNYEVTGPADAPALILAHSLCSNLHMWDPQAAELAKHFRLVRYDHRGHGRSDAPKGPYTMEMLGRDALAVLDAAGIRTASWCGVSMGGMVGMWVGAKSGRIEKLILSNTNYYYPQKDNWKERIATAREKGLAANADLTIERWFTPEFRQRKPEIVARMRNDIIGTSVEGYVGCCEAIRDMDHRQLLTTIKVPTLIIAGSQDVATTVADGEAMKSLIPGAKMAILDTAHIANIEQPEAYLREIMSFLKPRAI